jgi:lipid-A-disaccharide synthase
MKQIPFETPVFFCAGEPSGDLYAALFIKQLKKNSPRTGIFGVGGINMTEVGAELVFRYEKMMTFGLSDGCASFFENISIYRKIVRQLRVLTPRTFIAVAYPGMNLLLCRVAKIMGAKVYYLLPPQIWAWGTFRKYFIKKWVDVVISVFPFEADFYRSIGINTVLLDNPLVLKLRSYERKDHKKRIGFMPGSRISQIRRNLPVIRQLIRSISATGAGVEFCLIAYDLAAVRALCRLDEEIAICHENRYQVMKNCDLLITCSGTASFEACLLEVPQIFFNRPSFMDFHILRKILKTKEYNLCNIYYGSDIVPSFVHCDQETLVENVFTKIGFARVLAPR